MTETAVFGSGCFWCTEALFKELKGVLSVVPGYAGGSTKSPNYISVSSGKGNHAEVVKIEYDSSVIRYQDLLDIFFHTHDPTSLNRQGADVGTQYRSIILYTSIKQQEIAEKYVSELRLKNEFEKPIVTEIQKLRKFFEAESYHHNYYGKDPSLPYCQLVVSPKLQYLRKKFATKTR